MILIGIGVAIFIREFLYITDEAMMGLMFLFAGVAFLAYYFMVKNKSDNNWLEKYPFIALSIKATLLVGLPFL